MPSSDPEKPCVSGVRLEHLPRKSQAKLAKQSDVFGHLCKNCYKITEKLTSIK
jgi:hypothetical protein